MIRISIILLILLSTSHCGKATIRWGGIVDNGNKPNPPTPSEDQHPDNSPALVPTQLFDRKYIVVLPKNFTLKSHTSTKEEFLRGTTESLVFEIVKNRCQENSVTRNQHNIDIFHCDDRTIQLVGSNSEIIQCSHQLNSVGLKIITDSFKEMPEGNQ